MRVSRVKREVQLSWGGIASGIARRKIFVGWLGKLCRESPAANFLTLYRIRSPEKFQLTYLPFVRTGRIFPPFPLSNPFLRGSVFYLGSRYKQGLRLPGRAVFFRVRFFAGCVFRILVGRRDDRYSRFSENSRACTRVNDRK